MMQHPEDLLTCPLAHLLDELAQAVLSITIIKNVRKRALPVLLIYEERFPA